MSVSEGSLFVIRPFSTFFVYLAFPDPIRNGFGDSNDESFVASCVYNLQNFLLCFFFSFSFGISSFAATSPACSLLCPAGSSCLCLAPPLTITMVGRRRAAAASAPAAEDAVPPRAPAPKLSWPCCLRCSKKISAGLTSCRRKTYNHNCRRCSKQKGKCLEVSFPPLFFLPSPVPMRRICLTCVDS